MMLKEKSSPWARLKYLYVLPLAAIAVSAFARPEISNELNEISKVKVNDLAVIAEVNDAESVSQKNDSVMLIHGTSVVQYKEDGSLSHIEVLDDAEPSYTIVPSAQADEAKKDDQDKTTTLQLTGIKEGKEPLLIVDDKEVSYSILSAIDPSNIESIEVLKNEKATRKYGERGKNGVVVVTLKSVENRAIPKDVPQTGVFISDAKAHSRGNPIIILDGKEVGSIDSVDPSTIKSISVIKNISGASEDDVKLFEQYGEKAKDGIILITSKKSDDTSGVQLLSVQRRSKTIAVDGLVIDESGKPVAGAVVRIVGSQVGTVSDMEGKFSLEAQEIDYITVMFIGMKETVTKVSPKITVTLEKGD